MSKRSAERDSFLKDVVIGFVEDGGTNSWRQIERYRYETADPDDIFSPMVVAEATFIDVEDDDKSYAIDHETVAKGLGKLRRGEGGMNSTMRGAILAADAENDAGQIDAYDADAIVQLGVFGELVYG